MVVQKTTFLAFQKAISGKIPEKSVEMILEIWHQNPFNFRVSASRKTVLGNYIFKNNWHYITVNGDSNQYSFLITLVHEIAHQLVTIDKLNLKRNFAPHGKEWKNKFKELFQPFLIAEIFPEDVLMILKNHMKNPAASSTKDPALMKILDKYSININGKHEIEDGEYLENLNRNDCFEFKNMKYKKLENRRSRVLVQSLSNGKQYTIPKHAAIKKI